ncbi:MAG: transporter [Verrucomicrobiota bacterium]
MRPLPILLSTISIAALGVVQAAEPTGAEVTRLPTVTAASTSLGFAEDRPIDESQRPEWTSKRRFTTTRIYIQRAPWEVGAEQWWRVRQRRDGTVENKFQEEIEIGLPYRIQLDLYVDWYKETGKAAFYSDTAFEIRWALADWGKLLFNPTLYAEYKVVDPDAGPDVYEFKVLFGDTLTPRVHWGLNFAYEQEIGGERATEFAIQGGLSYSVIDEKLGVGIEMQYKDESTNGTRGTPERKFLIGPSVQWRPTSRTHLDLVAQWGTNADAVNFEGFVVFGVDFGKIGGGEVPQGYKPVSGRSR